MLNNINRIYRVPCSQLTGLVRTSQTEAKLDNVDWAEIGHIKRPAALTVTDKVEDGYRLFTAKLVFYACDWETPCEPTAFLCHTIDGDRILLGTLTKPYPVVTEEETHPASGSENQLTAVTVTLTTAVKPPKIRG